MPEELEYHLPETPERVIPQPILLVAKYSFYPILIWDSICLLIGILGVIIYGSFTSTLGPVYVINQNIGVWLCLVLGFMAIQNLYYLLRSFDTRWKVASFIVNLLYGGTSLLLAMVTFIGYVTYAVRIDAIIWSLCILITCLLNVLVIVLGWFTHLNPCIKSETYSIDNNTSYQLFDSQRNVKFERFKALFITGIVSNVVLRVFFFLILLLLATGAVFISEIVRYPMKGKIAKVQLSDGTGRLQNIHYLCEGPVDSNITFVFEGDFTHEHADYVDIQKHLTDMGRRSCIYDKPGLGHSDFLFKDQKNTDSFYHPLMKILGERTKLVLVGWGGGGSIIYKYGKEHPEMVTSLVFLDVFPEGIEYTSVRYLKNLSESDYLEYKNSDLSERKFIVDLINIVGVPFGLMSAFMYSNVKTSNRNEIAYWMKSEKTWIAQSIALDEMISSNFDSSVFDESISSTIPINLVISKHDDRWVIMNNYDCKKLGPTSKECLFEIESNKYYLKSQENIVKNLNGGSITYCTDDSCSPSYYTFFNPKYTAETLNTLYP